MNIKLLTLVIAALFICSACSDGVAPKVIVAADENAAEENSGSGDADDEAAGSTTAPSVSSSVSGLYGIDLAQNTCFGADASDADELRLEITEGAVTYLTIEDDLTEGVTKFDGDTVEWYWPKHTDIICSADIKDGVITGSCSDGTENCELYYFKCSDDPRGGYDKTCMDMTAATAQSVMIN